MRPFWSGRHAGLSEVERCSEWLSEERERESEKNEEWNRSTELVFMTKLVDDKLNNNVICVCMFYVYNLKGRETAILHPQCNVLAKKVEANTKR